MIYKGLAASTVGHHRANVRGPWWSTECPKSWRLLSRLALASQISYMKLYLSFLVPCLFLEWVSWRTLAVCWDGFYAEIEVKEDADISYQQKSGISYQQNFKPERLHIRSDTQPGRRYQMLVSKSALVAGISEAYWQHTGGSEQLILFGRWGHTFNRKSFWTCAFWWLHLKKGIETTSQPLLSRSLERALISPSGINVLQVKWWGPSTSIAIHSSAAQLGRSFFLNAWMDILYNCWLNFCRSGLYSACLPKTFVQLTLGPQRQKYSRYSPHHWLYSPQLRIMTALCKILFTD